MFPRWIKRYRFRLNIVLSLSSMLGCSTIAQWDAPKKAVETQAPAELAGLEKEFWEDFRSGQFERIPGLMSRYKALYFAHPGHPTIAARIGLLHLWRLTERRRWAEIPADTIDDAALCHKYFREAHALAPEDARYSGFHAACVMSEGDIDQDQKSLRRGYYLMKDAVGQWPEFNDFTAGFVLSNQPHQSDLFHEAVEYQWKNIEVCIDGKVDRQKPDYSAFAKLPKLEGAKRVCGNSWTAPHNFEGFLLNMGDMLVKQGKIEQAQQTYENAKLSKDYASWPYKAVLEQRIAHAAQNQDHFQQPIKSNENPDFPVIMVNSKFACMACHQVTGKNP